MNFSKQTGQLLALLLLTIVAYLLLYENSSTINIDASVTAKDEKPTAFISGAEFLIYDKEGVLSTQLHSSKALYFHNSDRITIQSPRITLNASGGRKINLTANEGEYFLSDERLYLEGDVEVKQATPETDAWQLNTEELELNSRAHFISTEQAVTIYIGKDLVKAVGLKAWLDENKINLLSKVRGRYVYTQTSP